MVLHEATSPQARDVRDAIVIAGQLRRYAHRCGDPVRGALALRLARDAGTLAVLRRTPGVRVAPQPRRFQRFDPSEALWRDLVAAAERALRAEQARFSQYAVTNSLVALVAAAQPRANPRNISRNISAPWRQSVRITDLLAGFDPDLDPTGILPVQATVYEDAGQNALGLLGIEATFAIRGDGALAARVAALFTDQLDGINATTRRQLGAVLDRVAGQDVGTVANALQDYWDWAAEVRSVAIARTEVARTSAAAEVDTFGRNGIETLIFSGDTSDDPPGELDCDDYLDQEFSADEAADIIPVHTNCTHYWLPYFPDGWSAPDDPWIGGPQTAVADLLEQRSLERWHRHRHRRRRGAPGGPVPVIAS